VSLIDLFPTLVELAEADEATDIDGHSLLGLLEDPSRADAPERVVLSEYHGEGVRAPCFMVRRGNFKYIHIHGHEAQLFDLADDPGETRNLAGDPGYRQVEVELREEVSSRFDPDAIAADVEHSQTERILMQRAMERGRPTTWDHRPGYEEVERGRPEELHD
jgi:choline-sulfatase